jgi:rhodanese-related sulfurtransferase
VHCAGGYRSIVAASILKARGIHNMIDVQGGYSAIKNTSAPNSDYVCPSTV